VAITIKEAKELADHWQAQREDAESQPYAGYYRSANADALIKMLETGKGSNGKKLNSWEFACLVERWVEVFGDFPAGKVDDSGDPDDAGHADPELLPADDTMLRCVLACVLAGG
jgi:hypothetical protein